MEVAAETRELDAQFSAAHPGYNYMPFSSAIDYSESQPTSLLNDLSVFSPSVSAIAVDPIDLPFASLAASNNSLPDL